MLYLPEPDEASQLVVVADLGVDVEREVSGIEGDVAVEERPDPPVPPPGKWVIPVPEKAVMHQEERRRQRLSRPDYRGERCVHRGHDPAHLPGSVQYLKTVDGVRLVGHLTDSKVLVEVGDEGGERNGF